MSKNKPEPRTEPQVVKAPERIELAHPKMLGRARVLEKDMAAWLKDGWQIVGSAGNAD